MTWVIVSILKGDGGWDKEYSADELEPYTKPETKDNMERKEFDLTEILKGCEGEKIFLVDQGECWIKSVTDDKITLIFNGNAIIELSGESVLIQRTGFAYAYPSKESFLANPLDAYSAWMEWKESRKPKRWRAKQNKEFYYFLDDMLIINDIVDSYDYFCNNRYNIGNYFRTTEEAQQAAEAVRECLKNLIKNTNKDQLSHESNS